MGAAVAFVLGLIMAIALGLSGMTQPGKIVGFLDFTGNFDPTLLFVMAGAVGVHFVSWRLITKRQKPLLASAFELPALKVIDRNLILGAVIFGLGWGVSGFCPGPALVSLGSFKVEVLIFVAAMATAQLIFKAIQRRYRSEFPSDI